MSSASTSTPYAYAAESQAISSSLTYTSAAAARQDQGDVPDAAMKAERKAARKAVALAARTERNAAAAAQLAEFDMSRVSTAGDLAKMMPPPPPSGHEPQPSSVRVPSLRSLQPVVRKDLRDQGWTTRWSKSRELFYFYNSCTGEKQWRPPEPPIGETAVGKYLSRVQHEDQHHRPFDSINRTTTPSSSLLASADSEDTTNPRYRKAAPPMIFDDARSVATSAISVHSTLHSRQRTQQRGIEKKELQRAVKRASHTAVPGSGHETHVLRYDGVAVITDAQTHKRVVSAWREGI